MFHSFRRPDACDVSKYSLFKSTFDIITALGEDPASKEWNCYFKFT